MTTINSLRIIALAATAALFVGCAKKDEAASAASNTISSAVKAAEDTKAKVEAKAGEVAAEANKLAGDAKTVAADAQKTMTDLKNKVGDMSTEDMKKAAAQAQELAAKTGDAYTSTMMKVSGLMGEQKYDEAGKALEGLTSATLSPEQKATVDQLKAAIKQAKDLMSSMGK
jgi:hypothetical protein